MPTFPEYAEISKYGYTEEHANIVERTEMDRGVPKQRRTQSDVLVSLPLNLLFRSAAAAEDFETWFYGDAGAGTVWFDWLDPRAGVTRQARVVAGTLGALQMQPTAAPFAYTTRTVTIEYLRQL